MESWEKKKSEEFWGRISLQQPKPMKRRRR